MSRRGASIGMPPMVGLITGNTEDVARRLAEISVPKEVLESWCEEQANLIDPSDFVGSDLVAMCQQLRAAGGKASHLPFGLLNGKFQSWSSFVDLIASQRQIRIPLSVTDYSKNFYIEGLDKAASYFYSDLMAPDVIIVHCERKEISLGDESYRREIVERKGLKFDPALMSSLRGLYPLSDIIEHCAEVWGGVEMGVEVSDALKPASKSGPKARWMLYLQQGSRHL